MQVTPGRTENWWVSPAIPTIANCALAVLWFFSAFGGWGDAAFCGEGEFHDPVCGAAFASAVRLSIPAAVLAAAVAVTAWSTPGIRRRTYRLDALLTLAALIWVFAEGALFIGGHLAKP